MYRPLSRFAPIIAPRLIWRLIRRLHLRCAPLLMVLLGLLIVSACTEKPADRQVPVVLAASSLQEALEAVADAWAAKGHDRPILSFAGTPTLARQVQNGASADIALLADEQWMDVLEEKQFLAPGTRRALLGNRLVFIAPNKGQRNSVLADPTAVIAKLGSGRLAMADPDAVPAGRYGRAALQSLGIWQAAKTRIAPTQNVRAALVLVERGAVPLGLVYQSDLASSSKVHLAAIIPETAQPPIRYPAALLANSTARDAHAFLAFLASSEAEKIFGTYQLNRLAQR